MTLFYNWFMMQCKRSDVEKETRLCGRKSEEQ